MVQPDQVLIYGLVDPRTDCLRYVGKTSDIAKRYSRHCHPNKRDISHRACWLRGVLNASCKPVMVELEWVVPAVVDQIERFWIASLRAAGADLVNICDGGEGGNRGMLGRKLTPEHKVKIRDAHFGIRPSTETRAKLSRQRSGRDKGMKRSEDARKRISEGTRLAWARRNYPIKHGTIAGYSRNCRCMECAEASRTYQRARRLRAKST